MHDIVLTSAHCSAPAAVQKGRTAPLPGLYLVPEGQEAQQAQRAHHPCHHHAVQCCGGLRCQHGVEAQTASTTRQSADHPALDRHRSGMFKQARTH